MSKTMKRVFANNIELLSYLWRFSKSYPILNFLAKLLIALIPAANILVQGYALNGVIYRTASFVYVVFLIVIFNSTSFFISLFETWVVEKHNIKESEKIKRDFNILMLNKVKEIDIENYENPQFYDDYVRASSEVDARVFEVYDIIQNALISFVFIGVLVTTITTMKPIYMLFSLLLVLNSVFVVAKNNKVNYDWTMSRTAINRRHAYIAEVFYLQRYSKEMKTYSMYDLFINKYNGIINEILEIQKIFSSKIFKNLLPYKLFEPLLHGVAILMLLYEVYNKNILAGNFFIIFNSIYLVSGKMTELITSLPRLSQTSLYVDNLLKVLNKKPKICDNINGTDFSNITIENINISNLKFEYNNSNGFYALYNISMNIKKGQKVAIVGKNGSGKSTFVKLLLYLYQPNEGSIHLNNVPYNDIVTKSIRSKFGTVFQDFQIYAMSIAENILMRDINSSDIDEKLVWDALDFSDLSEKVKQCEKTIYANLTKEFDDSGIYLSGGEIQKLAIARAYAQNCEILVFDEPSSALDPLAEHQFFEKLLKLGSNKTVIYISHRLATTVDADYIYLFDSGQIVESGIHNELMTQKGHYYDMFSLQAEKYVKEV